MSLFTLIGAGVVVWLIVAFVVAIGFGRVIARRDQQTPATTHPALGGGDDA